MRYVGVNKTGGTDLTLIDCIEALMSFENADSIRLDDGANVWDLSNLYDAVISCEHHNESVEHSVQPDGIYALGDNGYLISPPAYRIRDAHQLQEAM